MKHRVVLEKTVKSNDYMTSQGRCMADIASGTRVLALAPSKPENFSDVFGRRGIWSVVC